MIEWMGRYRPIVAALVQHVNSVAKNGVALYTYGDIYLTPNEWQVLEYIVEHRDEDMHMADMISALAIPQSSFSRIQKKLCGLGLLERYQTTDNKKNIILKPTKLAQEAYEFHSSELYTLMFKPFFDELEDFSDEELARFAHAIETLSKGANREEEKTSKAKLVKLN